MGLWIYFWGAIVSFSVVSFAYMSGKILYKSIAELKSMFNTLEERRRES